jgi:hypothetical protein
LEREISRGRFLNARFGVNGIQNAARSLGTSARGAAADMACLPVLIDFLNNARAQGYCPVVALFAPF